MTQAGKKDYQQLEAVYLSSADYQQALELGEVLVAYARVMMIGPGGVGKSSFLRGLMNQTLARHARSTILADTKTVKPQFWAKAGESADSYWAEVTDQDEIKELAELAQLVAQVKSGGSTPSRAATFLSSMTTSDAVGVFKPLGFTPHKDPTMQDDNVSSIKDDIVRIILQQVLEHTQQSIPGNPAVPRSEVLMHVWDCGGQPVFLDVLAAFLTSRTMFLLFFDARQNLLDTCSSLSYNEGRVVSKSEQNFTLLQLLTQWMASIHAMLTRKGTLVGAIPEAFITPDSQVPAIEGDDSNPFDGMKGFTADQQNVFGHNIPKFPRIIPVGTHGDDPKVQEKKVQICSILQSHCEYKAYTHLLLNSVIVDNTTAGRGKEAEDEGFKYIRESVHQLASKHLAIRTPVAWVLFRKVLQKVAKDNPIVSYEQALAVGEACGITTEVVPSVLHFYHELAVFLHYTKIERLCHHIIADPQWLITQLGRLLAPEGLEQKLSNHLLWKPLREYGILVQPLYEEVWEENNINYNIQPQSLADLLEHFLLAARIDSHQTTVSQIPGRKYFIPSVLRLSMQDTISRPKSRKILKQSSHLHLTFSTQYVPPGFFTRLATTLTKKSKCQPMFEQGVFRNKITLAYGEVDELVVMEHSSSVQITIFRTEHRQLHIPMFGSVCCDVMKLVQLCSATVLEWLPSIKVEKAFLCEQCSDKNHFIPISSCARTDSLLRCSSGHSCHLTKEQQYWLKIPHTEGGLSDSELRGVADDVQKAEKLADLADSLETVLLLKSLEGDTGAPFKLLQRWCRVENTLEAHSLLVHHLRCIGLTETSDKLLFCEFVSQPGTFAPAAASMHCYGDDHEKELLSVSQITLCSRHIDGDLTLLAAVLDISDEEVATIKSKFKNTRSQVLQMLKKWQASGTHTKQELTEILHDTGFKRAASMLASLGKHLTTQHKGDNIPVFPDMAQILKADRAQDTKDSGNQVTTATLQQQPSSSLPTPSTQLAFIIPGIETGALSTPHGNMISSQAVATSATVDRLNEHSLKAILDSISTVAADWFNLGVALGLPYYTLKRIESDYPRDAPRCLTEMIIAWLQNSSQPTWQGLVFALMSPLVNRVDIANTIATKHLHSCT